MRMFIIMIMVLACRFGMATDYDQSEANLLLREFIFQLQENKPFTYEDEVKYFGELTLYSVSILQDFGYIDQAGRWLKEKPEYSYLCELMRLYSDAILQKDSKTEFYFSNISQTTTLDGSLVDDDSSYAPIAYVQHQTFPWRDEGALVKIVLLYYNLPHKKLSFPVFVNNQSLAEIMGFKLESPKNPIPRLTESAKEELLSFVAKNK